MCKDNLIDGEGKRNAYWQMAIDKKGFIHLSRGYGAKARMWPVTTICATLDIKRWR
jgi:hypothetical protein